MAPKLLSFIIIATSLSQSNCGLMHALPPAAADTASVRAFNFDNLHLNDFKHPSLTPYTGRPMSGPVELPRGHHVDRLPYQAFPENEKLQDLASQQAVWIKNNNFQPPSIETEAEWSQYAETYNNLKRADRKQLYSWLKSDVYKDSPPEAMTSARVSWFLSRGNKKIWWKASLFKNANVAMNEDIYLVKIGDILGFGNPKHGLKVSGKDAKRMAYQLHQVFFKTLERSLRSKGLPLDLLKPVQDVTGASLYQERVTALTNGLWETIPRMARDDPAKNQMLEVLFSAYGAAPAQARAFASTALENTAKDPALWAKLPRGTWGAFDGSLKVLRSPLKA